MKLLAMLVLLILVCTVIGANWDHSSYKHWMSTQGMHFGLTEQQYYGVCIMFSCLNLNLIPRLLPLGKEVWEWGWWNLLVTSDYVSLVQMTAVKTAQAEAVQQPQLGAWIIKAVEYSPSHTYEKWLMRCLMCFQTTLPAPLSWRLPTMEWLCT